MVGALAAATAVMAALVAPAMPAVRVTRPHPDADALADAGWRRPLWQWEIVRCASIAAALAIALAARVPVPIGAVAGAAIPSIGARVRASAAWREARRASTRLLWTAEATMRAGGSLPEALRRAAESCDDELARRPFAAALRAFDLGAPLDAAMRDAAPAADRRARLALETLAIGVSSRLSSDRAAALVGAVVDRLAFEERIAEEVRARTNGARLQVVALALIVPALAVYLAVTVPALAATLGSPLGRGVLVPAAVALELIGIVASRRAIEGLDE